MASVSPDDVMRGTREAASNANPTRKRGSAQPKERRSHQEEGGLRMIRILLQTTIPAVDDDWNIRRYSLLRGYLASLEDERGKPLFAVTGRDREPDARGDDPVLSGLADSDFDEIWLFGADTGNGLSGRDCAGITAFRHRGRGILATRDHQDAGSSIYPLGGVGAAHFFH